MILLYKINGIILKRPMRKSNDVDLELGEWEVA